VTPMIDKDKVKAFWDARAHTFGSLDFNSIANLEQDPENLTLKVRLESQKVFEYLGPIRGKTILDLGAGVGQWAFRFAERDAGQITAVEYSAELAEIGRREARRRGVLNVEFVISPAESFTTGKTFDIVFISGLFVYMNDDQAEQVTANLAQFCHSETLVLLRDGTGLEKRHEIDNRFSEHLQTDYSATYRTAAEYESLFTRYGFEFLRHENMFDEDCALNKYAETRLRIYLIRLARTQADSLA
jgi:cyclopropane fatty-acyl-phospholipid synthase-like methyltransferase